MSGAVVALLVVAVVVVLIVVTSSGGTSASSSGLATPTTNAPGANRPHAPSFDPSHVAVAVLNGTSTSGLAHRVALKLTQIGFRQGAVVTAPDQTHTTTIIAYTPGNRADALHVASALRRSPASVQPIDAATQAVACPPPAACTVQVVVTVGADLATAA